MSPTTQKLNPVCLREASTEWVIYDRKKQLQNITTKLMLAQPSTLVKLTVKNPAAALGP